MTERTADIGSGDFELIFKVTIHINLSNGPQHEKICLLLAASIVMILSDKQKNYGAD